MVLRLGYAFGMPSLDDLRLNLAGWELEREDGTEAVWSNEERDVLATYYYDLPPDIGARLEELGALRAFYRDAVVEAGGALVQVDVATVAGIPAVETVFKFPQEPTGMTYVGSITLPFEAFSFVVRAQCAEHGITGMRDAAVLAGLNLEIDESTGEPVGWMQDPYDPEFAEAVLRNRADDAEWDEKFPDHPLSRCRRNLGTAKTAVSLSGDVRVFPLFTGPPETKKQGWWRFGKR